MPSNRLGEIDPPPTRTGGQEHEHRNGSLSDHEGSKVVCLKDYRPPDYRIGMINCVFEIVDPTRVKVAAVLDLERNSELDNYGVGAEGAVLPRLELDLGSEQTVVVEYLEIDGRLLGSDEFERLSDKLVLQPESSSFRLKIGVVLNPRNNRFFEGMYEAKGTILTQCEPQGYRNIVPSVDRPDNMAKMITTLVADKKDFPVLLSNGDELELADINLSEGKHVAGYRDDNEKPSYLFALVAGKLEVMEDEFVYPDSGKKVRLKIYTEKGDIGKCRHAMDSLKSAMLWKYLKFGLVCDLEEYRIVGTSKFASGAMENRGLNIFAATNLIFDPEISTDEDNARVGKVIPHEFFHDWNGSYRDWFQISLKEGLAVFMEQLYIRDMADSAAERVKRVRFLREQQFRADAYPDARPIKPQSYRNVGNLYNSTAYEKSAEVVGMIYTFLGAEKFSDGVKLYFARYNGRIVTTEDFIRAMSDASGLDLSQFEETWYNQQGTPTCKVISRYDEDAKTLTMVVEQSPGESANVVDKPYYFPLKVGLIGRDGKDMELRLARNPNNLPHDFSRGVLHIDGRRQTFIFEDVNERPVVSLMRNFSAPMILDADYSLDELRFLMKNDIDGFNRYEASRKVINLVLKQLIDQSKGGEDLTVSPEILEIYGGVIESGLVNDGSVDFGMIAEMLMIPSEGILAYEMKVYQYDLLKRVRDFLIEHILLKYGSKLEKIIEELDDGAPYSADSSSIAKRTLKNICLEYLSKSKDRSDYREELLLSKFNEANNMTDLFAVVKLLRNSMVHGKRILDIFKEKCRKGGNLTFKKYLMAVGGANREDVLELICEAENSPEYCSMDEASDPHVWLSLYGSLLKNPVRFHHESGDAYQFLTDRILSIDKKNADIAARLLSEAYSDIAKFSPGRRGLILVQLERIKTHAQSGTLRLIAGKLIESEKNLT